MHRVLRCSCATYTRFHNLFTSSPISLLIIPKGLGFPQRVGRHLGVPGRRCHAAEGGARRAAGAAVAIYFTCLFHIKKCNFWYFLIFQFSKFSRIILYFQIFVFLLSYLIFLLFLIVRSCLNLFFSFLDVTERFTFVGQFVIHVRVVRCFCDVYQILYLLTVSPYLPLSFLKGLGLPQGVGSHIGVSARRCRASEGGARRAAGAAIAERLRERDIFLSFIVFNLVLICFMCFSQIFLFRQ